jgi:hypothetical protein
MHHLCTFGCVAHVKTMGNLKKLDDSSKPTIFVGYVLGSKSYRTYDSATQQVSTCKMLCLTKKQSGTGAVRSRAASSSSTMCQCLTR